MSKVPSSSAPSATAATALDRALRGRFGGDAGSSVSARRGGGDGGYVLAMTALMIIPILVFTAMAVDLGAWYAQGSKMQRAADAAAMAGVVWMPSTATSSTEATRTATANGFSAGGGTTVSASPYLGSTHQYQVTITKPAPRYFSTLFKSSFNMSRTAVAEFNKPIPMGAPASSFGNDMKNIASCPSYQPRPTAPCGPMPMLWSAINGTYALYENGDPYSTRCNAGGGAGTGCTQGNPYYRNTGYSFAIDVPASEVGFPITIQGWDMGTYSRSINNGSSGADCMADVAPFATDSNYTSGGSFRSGFTSANCQTGDSGSQQNMRVQLYENDGSDLSISFATLHSSCQWTRLSSTFASNVATYKNQWTTICTFTPTQAGIYPLRVRNSGFGQPDAGDGTNAYALKLLNGGSAASSRLYSLEDMSIYTNTPASTSRFYLAEILPQHAGKKLRIDLYDPGDGNAGNFFMQVKGPAAGAPTVPPGAGTTIPNGSMVTECRYNSSPSNTKGPPTPATAPNCRVQTRVNGAGNANVYNGRWLRIEVQLASTYTCGTGGIPDCWWGVQYDFVNSAFPTDRTVWSMQVVGDPVHLIK